MAEVFQQFACPNEIVPASTESLPEGGPALHFSLASGLSGAASAALDYLVKGSPELGFRDLLADARGERELPWLADDRARGEVRQLCLAQQQHFGRVPAVPPPPRESPQLEAWANSFSQLPLLSLSAGTTLARWLPDPLQVSLEAVPLAKLLTDPQGDAAARSLASAYLWARALLGGCAASEPSGVPAPPPAAPGSARERTEAIIAACDREIARYLQRHPKARARCGSTPVLRWDPGRGEMGVRSLFCGRRIWTFVGLAGRQVGVTRCECLAEHRCIHRLRAWQAVADALRGELDHLDPSFLDFLGVPADLDLLGRLEHAVRQAESTPPPSLSLSWWLSFTDRAPVLTLRLGHGPPKRSSPRLREADVATLRRFDFPNRDLLLGLVSAAPHAEFPAVLVARALELLVGQSQLMLADGADLPLRVRRGTVDLVLTRLGAGRFRLTPRVDGSKELGEQLLARTSHGPTRILALPAEATCVIVELTEPQRALLDTLRREDELLADRLDTLLPRLRVLERHLPVGVIEQHLPVLELAAPDAPRRLPAEVLLLLRAGEGAALRAELRVVSGDERTTPGLPVPTDCDADEVSWLEARRAEQLAAWLGLPSDGAMTGYGWDLTEDAALGLLNRLRYRKPDQPVVEWAGERRLEMLLPPRAQQLALRVEEAQEGYTLTGEIEVGQQRLSLAAALAAVRAGSRWAEVAPGSFVELVGELRKRLELVAAVAVPSHIGFSVSAENAQALELLCAIAGKLELCEQWVRRRSH